MTSHVVNNSASMARTVRIHGCSKMTLVFFLPLFLVPCGRLNWPAVSIWAHVNIAYPVDNRNFWCVQMSPRTRNKAHCNIDVRKAFFTNRVVDIWNSLPAAVVLSQNVSTFKRRLTEFNFYRFLRYT